MIGNLANPLAALIPRRPRFEAEVVSRLDSRQHTDKAVVRHPLDILFREQRQAALGDEADMVSTLGGA